VSDRSKWVTRKLQSGEPEPPDEGMAALTPGQRVEMVEELTKQAWIFKEGRWNESRLRRDVVRVIRSKS
jgi:hypothetical protein